MQDWLSRYGAFGLIFAGWLLLTGLIPSAAGPADALRGAGGAAPPGFAPAGTAAAPALPRLIASSHRGPLGHLAHDRDGQAPAGGAIPAAATAPAMIPPTAAPAPTAVATAAPAAADATALEPAPEAAPDAAPEAARGPTDRLVIPRIGLDVKVIDVGLRPGGEMETAAFAVGRLALSAQAGEPGNTVLAGHNDVDGEVFRRLPELRPGDDLRLYRGDAAYRYVVVVRTVVREEGATPLQRFENARWMDPTERPSTTLITCYPYRVDTHRVIVHAVLTEGP